MTGRIKTIGKVGGMAASTAPYVRRIATDEDLRDDVADFIRSANNLLNHLRSDKRLRRDLRTMMDSVQSSADRVRGDVRPRHVLRNLLIGTGLVIAAIVAGIAVAWPRARRTVSQAVDQGASRANVVVHDVREKLSREPGESQAA
ncbi:MAG: hypothetical protein GX624_13175 [Actinobacteria bacterium]|nr:hypothetical protein [Actinomycetota bacterium]